MTRAAIKNVLTVIALLVAQPIAGHGQTEGFTITGTVVDKSTGNPLQYAVVGLPGHKSWSLSDQNGVFTLTGLEGGPDRFVVLRRGYNYADHNVRLTGPMEFRVEMTPEDVSAPVGPGRIVGRVLDQVSGRPIEGVTVALAPTAQQAETDARGRFEITDVSPGALLLQARRVGYQPRVDTIAAFPAVTVDVELTLVPLCRRTPICCESALLFFAPWPDSEMFPVPLVWIVALFASRPMKFPVVIPVEFALSVIPPSTVVRLEPEDTTMFFPVLRLMAPMPVVPIVPLTVVVPVPAV